MRQLGLFAALFAALVASASGLPAAGPEPGLTALIDTGAGRLTCTLLTQERPATTAAFVALARGTTPWTDHDGSTGHTTPFYDGTRIFPGSEGIRAGVRAVHGEPSSGASFPAETQPPLPFDRPGLLAMAATAGQAGPSRFFITDHANTESDGHGVVFGQCDARSVQLVRDLRHQLQSTDNHPAKAVAIVHITILPAGQPVPPLASADPAMLVLPAQGPAPLAAPSGPEPTGPVAVIETSAGSISCRLFTKESPIATSTFLGLADGSKDWTNPVTHRIEHHRRFYDGQHIDRVLPDFYIQFGDITGDISGNTDIGFRFKNENTPGLTFDRPGRLAFGNGGPDTNNSELFFSLNPMHVLDGGFPIIGQCDQTSVKLLKTLAGVPRSASNLPLTPIVIRHITVHP